MPDHPTLPPRDPNTIDHSPDGPATVPPRDPNATLPPAGPERPTDTRLQPPMDPSAAIAGSADVPGYELLGELGRGGMGVVYRARQVALNRPVALKMVLAGGHVAPEDLARFLAEAEAIAALQHSGVVQVFDYGTRDGLPYFALELCPGGSLAAKLAGKPLPPREAAELVEKIARAVQHAHEKGIVHRDLKPGNILLADDGTPKVTDFGLAKRVEGGAGLTQTGAILGTPSYMAPEQAGGPGKSIGSPADVYALGAILYECLTGRPPFLAATALDTVLQVVSEEPVPLRQQNPQAPADLETAAHKCLQKEPGKRYASAAALADDLSRWLRGEPIAARPVGTGERLMRWARRNRALAAALTAATAFLIGGAAVAVAFAVASSAAERKATAQAQSLGAETDKLERALSRMNFFLGQARWHEGRSADVTGLLDRVSPEDRGFEWGYIRRQNAGGFANLPGFSPGAFSPDGRQLAAASNVFLTFNLWDAATGAEIATFRLDRTALRSVAFRPDGRQLVSADDDGTLTFWDTATGAKLAEIRQRETHQVLSIAFSPDGRRLASASWGGTVTLWDAATGTELVTLRGHTSSVYSVAFSPDGQRLASTGADQTRKLWNAATGAELATLHGHTGRVNCVAFSPDGRSLASASSDQTLKTWDAASGIERATIRGHTSQVNVVTFSPDGRRLASGSVDGTIKLWDAANGTEQASLRGNTGSVSSLAFNPDGRRLASAGRFQWTLRLWDTATGAELVTFRGHRHEATSTTPGPDGQRVPAVRWELTQRSWGRAAVPKPTTLRGSPASVNSVVFSPDGRRLATGSDDKTLKLWDAVTGAELTTFRGHTELVSSVAFSPDGRRLASASWDQTLRVWDAASGAELTTFRGHTGYVTSVAFSSDGRCLASGSDDTTLKLWDAATGTEIVTLGGHTKFVTSVAFSKDGRRLASASDDGTSKLWDTATRDESASLRVNAAVNSVAFSPDGRRLVTAGDAQWTPIIWDAATGGQLTTFRDHKAIAMSVAFSPDGRRLALGGNDKAITLWDTATGSELVALRGHTAMVTSVAFSPGGRRLASASEDGTVKLWDASDPSLLDEWELGQRRFHARVNPWWHQEQAEAAAKSNDAAAVAFHRGWVATAWPDDADAWKQLDAACSPKQMLAACDRILDANPNNAAARRRRALYRGSAAAAVAGFAAGWPGLTPIADW